MQTPSNPNKNQNKKKCHATPQVQVSFQLPAYHIALGYSTKINMTKQTGAFFLATGHCFEIVNKFFALFHDQKLSEFIQEKIWDSEDALTPLFEELTNILSNVGLEFFIEDEKSSVYDCMTNNAVEIGRWYFLLKEFSKSIEIEDRETEMALLLFVESSFLQKSLEDYQENSSLMLAGLPELIDKKRVILTLTSDSINYLKAQTELLESKYKIAQLINLAKYLQVEKEILNSKQLLLQKAINSFIQTNP